MHRGRLHVCDVETEDAMKLKDRYQVHAWAIALPWDRERGIIWLLGEQWHKERAAELSRSPAIAQAPMRRLLFGTRDAARTWLRDQPIGRGMRPVRIVEVTTLAPRRSVRKPTR
jgi:hypothetical protein